MTWKYTLHTQFSNDFFLLLYRDFVLTTTRLLYDHGLVCIGPWALGFLSKFSNPQMHVLYMCLGCGIQGNRLTLWIFSKMSISFQYISNRIANPRIYEKWKVGREPGRRNWGNAFLWLLLMLWWVYRVMSLLLSDSTAVLHDIAQGGYAWTVMCSTSSSQKHPPWSTLKERTKG